MYRESTQYKVKRDPMSTRERESNKEETKIA